jgi:hypothetical protein
MKSGLQRARRTGRLARVIASAVLVVALMSAPAATAAGSSGQDAYNAPGPRIQQQVQDPSRGLPFTGLDLLPLLGVGCTLVVVGVGMHRVLGTRG